MDPKSPLADSPWFWVMIFSLMALGALAAIGGKYGRRQAVIERQYQAREQIADRAENAADVESPRRDYAMPGETLVPLWPLAVILFSVAAFAAVMLIRARGRAGLPGVDTSPR